MLKYTKYVPALTNRREAHPVPDGNHGLCDDPIVAWARSSVPWIARVPAALLGARSCAAALGTCKVT